MTGKTGKTDNKPGKQLASIAPLEPGRRAMEFSVDSFWAKLKAHAASAGRDVCELALKLFYAWQDPATPQTAKAIIVGALVYFIVPTDAVMDFLPGGYVDDWGALLGALWTVASHIREEHEQKAKEKLAQWFGDPSEDQ